MKAIYGFAAIALAIASPAAAQQANGSAPNKASYTQERARGAYFNEGATPLAANAVFTGAVHDAGASPSQWAPFSCLFRTDAASASIGAQAQESADGVTFVPIASGTTGTSTLLVTGALYARYARCVITNSTTAETSLVIWSRFGI